MQPQVQDLRADLRRLFRQSKDLGIADGSFKLHRCRVCTQPLGRYDVGPQMPESDGYPFSFWNLGDHLFADITRRWIYRPVGRPRTGTGLYPESYAGRSYVRVRCKCGPNGRNEKLRLDKYLELPVSLERGELVVYL